jgi:hypothetical protein
MRHFLHVFIAICWCTSAMANLYLRDNLKKAEPGDFIVTVQNKTCTLLHIHHKEGNVLTIEEISLPIAKAKQIIPSWHSWVQADAPGHTSWMMYTINLNGSVERCFSFSKGRWLDPSSTENFLGTLLNLSLRLVPLHERKKVGNAAPGQKRIWEPKLVVGGTIVPGVSFNAWKTRWPNDGSFLSSKTIEVYVPAENTPYPSYFPYWLQISGMLGNAQLRIVDSGKGLVSPKPSLFQLEAHP